MKKTIAMLLATTTALSLGVTALADDMMPLEEITSGTESSSSEVSSSEVSSSEASSSEGSSAVDSSSSEVSTPENNENQQPVGDPSSFAFDADKDSGAILGDTLLEPGTEYKFPIFVMIGEQKVAVDEKLMETYKFSHSKVSSNSLKTFKVEEGRDGYHLIVETKDSTPLKPVEVKYNLKLVKKADNLSVISQQIKLSYGYEESNGDYITGLDKGDEVEIDNSRPVITDKQFDKIAKINDYKNVTLSGPSWKFTVNVTDESTKNMVSSNSGVKEVLAQFPEQEFKFFKFAGKPSFSSTGRVALDVEDIMDDFSKMYTYRYSNGKLYRLNATFNEEESTLEFRTNTLDTFVVTDKLIKDGTVINNADKDEDKDTSGKDEENSSGSGNSDKNNPTTGASDMINAAVLAAIAALGTAGTVAFKKASK